MLLHAPCVVGSKISAFLVELVSDARNSGKRFSSAEGTPFSDPRLIGATSAVAGVCHRDG
jgi:hypothetical protein